MLCSKAWTGPSAAPSGASELRSVAPTAHRDRLHGDRRFLADQHPAIEERGVACGALEGNLSDRADSGRTQRATFNATPSAASAILPNRCLI